jgi:hypothetical protein
MKIVNTLMISCLLLISSEAIVQAKIDHTTHINHNVIKTSTEFKGHTSQSCGPMDPRC